MTSREIAEKARTQLAEMTGLEPSSVSAITRHDHGDWRVCLDMVELRRIPDTTNVLGIYEALLDDDGNLVSYKRTKRYFRDQTTEEG